MEVSGRPGRDEAGGAAPATGAVVLLTGLPGAGKTTLGAAVTAALEAAGTPATHLDGDEVRRTISAGLGFSAEDRATHVRRVGWVAARIARHGGVVVVSLIAPEDAVRREVARLVREAGARMALVHVATPVAECERRDPKGLYARARAGDLVGLTGVDAAYEIPAEPDLRLDTTGRTVDECRDAILALI